MSKLDRACIERTGVGWGDIVVNQRPGPGYLHDQCKTRVGVTPDASVEFQGVFWPLMVWNRCESLSSCESPPMLNAAEYIPLVDPCSTGAT